MFNDNLKKIMKEKNIRPRELAEKLNITPAHLSYVLNGKRNVSVDLARKIADVLNVSISSLFLDDEYGLYKSLDKNIPEFFKSLQKSLFESIKNDIDKYGKEFIITLSEAINIPQDELENSFSSLERFALLSVDTQSHILDNWFEVRKSLKSKHPIQPTKPTKPNPKDLLEILEEEEYTLNGQIATLEDKKRLRLIVQAMYWNPKK